MTPYTWRRWTTQWVAAMKMAGRERWWMRFGSNNGVDEIFFSFPQKSNENGWDKGLVKIWEIKNPGFLYPGFQLAYQTQGLGILNFISHPNPSYPVCQTRPISTIFGNIYNFKFLIFKLPSIIVSFTPSATIKHGNNYCMIRFHDSYIPFNKPHEKIK